MDAKIIVMYCLCDDLLRAMQHREDARCQMAVPGMEKAAVAMLSGNRCAELLERPWRRRMCGHLEQTGLAANQTSGQARP